MGSGWATQTTNQNYIEAAQHCQKDILVSYSMRSARVAHMTLFLIPRIGLYNNREFGIMLAKIPGKVLICRCTQRFFPCIGVTHDNKTSFIDT